MLDHMEEEAASGGFSGDERDSIIDSACLAIVRSSGRQCTNSQTTGGLCGNHDKARSVTRVDEIGVGPFRDLRDELVDVGLNGKHAYALAGVTPDPNHLLKLATSLDELEAGKKTYEASTLASLVDTIAKHPDVDAHDHPLAEDQCIALTGSDRFDGRCTNGTYATDLLCGTHNANDPDTIYDDDAPDEHRIDFPHVEIDGVEQLFVGERGIDVIVVDTDDWVVERVPHEDVDRDDLVDARRDRRELEGDQDEKTLPSTNEGDDMTEAETVDQDEDDEPETTDGHVDVFVFDRRTDELEDVGLSGREAEVVACKEQGLTHPQIAEYVDLPKSTVDEYSRRSRNKLKQARALVDEIGSLYE
jgi:DNA-directed RNA polymerase specialized sigma24 family protein